MFYCGEDWSIVGKVGVFPSQRKGSNGEDQHTKYVRLGLAFAVFDYVWLTLNSFLVAHRFEKGALG